MSQKIEGQSIACIVECLLQALEDSFGLWSVIILHVKQIRRDVLQNVRGKREEERMEDLLVADMSSVIFGDNFTEPVWDVFIHFVEFYSLDYLLIFTLFLNNLSDFTLELLFVNEHISALAPII